MNDLYSREEKFPLNKGGFRGLLRLTLALTLALTLTLTLALTLTLTLALTAFAVVDPPHRDKNSASPFYCNDCHKYRVGSTGVNEEENPLSDLPSLCMQCHNPAGRAKEKSFARTDQSQIGKKGTTHRFDSEGLQYVKLWRPMDSTGKVRIYFDSSGNKSMYTGNFDTQNEMEYEFEIVNQGDVGAATFKYRCRTRSKPQPTNSTNPFNTPVWDRDTDWSNWTSAYTTAASISLDDSLCGGDRGIKLSFENSTESPSFKVETLKMGTNEVTAGTGGRVYVKLLNSPSDDNMKLRVQNNKINCSVCHNQHSMQLDRPYLRANNVGNALCKRCHDDRDRSHYMQEMGEAKDGTSDSSGQSTLSMTDTTKNWTTNQWVGKWVYFQKNFKGVTAVENIEVPFNSDNPNGYGGFYRKITSNTSNTLYWDDTSLYLNGALNAKIENTLRYRIVDTNNYSSHPLGIVYSQMNFETRFNSDIKPLPLDDNGTPSDTSDDTVQCMTCHSPHFAHSVNTEGGAATSGTTTSLTDTTKTWTANSLVGYEIRIRNEWTSGTSDTNPNWRRRRVIIENTADTVSWFDPLVRRSSPDDSSTMFDSPISAGDVYEIVNTTSSNPLGGAGDGYILRKANGYVDGYIRKYTNVNDDKVICKTCHKYKNHFGDETVGGYARSCMDCHTPHNTTNRFLLKEVINNREVRIRPGDNYVNSSRTGVCQVCHTQTRHWRNDGTEPVAHYAEGCPQCHQHDSEERSWIFICKTCHGYPPVPRGTIVDKVGKIHTSTTDADCTTDNPCTKYDTFNQNVLRSSYRVEDYEGGGGAHLVHVVGQLQQFECKVCHGHMGYGDKHGGSVGRKMVDRLDNPTEIRKYVTYNFQLDYSFNERLETKIGYHDLSTPVYPKAYNIEAGTSEVYVNRADATGGYGPGPKDLGDIGEPADKHECYVGCHNPRRLYMMTEPESDMVDTVGSGRYDPIEAADTEGDTGYGNKFEWTWSWYQGTRYKGVLPSNVPPRDENPDVPCVKCHDAQGTIMQGNEDNSPQYKGVKYISSHPADVTIRTDCLVCHDYYNAAKPHKKGTPYLNHKDGEASIEFDITNPSSLEPFCLSCHDSNGATDGNTATGNPKRPFSKETDVSNEVPNHKTNWTGSAHSANISCIGDGVSNGCHGNPMGSAKRSLLAPYNDSVGEEQKYFCFNCHGNNPDRITLAPNIQDQIQKKDVPGQSGHPIPAAGEPWYHKRKEAIIVGNRHSECIDCHDPMADRSTHRLRGQRFVDIDGNPWDPDRDTVASTHPMWGGDTNTTTVTNCTTTLGSSSVITTNNFNTAGLVTGMLVTGTGIASDTHISSINNKTSITLDKNATAGGTVTLTFAFNYIRHPYVYEVCFRCHGPNYATFFKDYMPFPQVAKDRVGLKGHFSDKRKEFDPRSNQFADYPASGNLGANTAYHPVAFPGRNATDPLYRQLQEAFDLTSVDDLKTLTIQCPDCHNNNVLGASSTGLRGPVTYSNRRSTDKTPAVVNTPNTFSNLNQRQDDNRIGPHGSTNGRILRAPYNTNVYYSRTARGSYGTVGATFGSGGARDNLQLCFLCHKESVLLCTTCDSTNYGTNFGGWGNGWWTANLHAEHLSASTYSGSEGGQAVCHECHHNVHSNVEAQNTIYGDGLGGMLPPDSEDYIIDGVSSTHLLNFGPQAQGATALKPRWYYDGEYYRCDMYCHGANMNYCWYKHGQSGSISQWCEDD